MKYDCQKLTDLIKSSRETKADFDKLLERNKATELFNLQKKMLKEISPAFAFCYWRDFECKYQEQQSMTLDNDEIAISLSDDGKQLIRCNSYGSRIVIENIGLDKNQSQSESAEINLGSGPNFNQNVLKAPVLPFVDQAGKRYLVAIVGTNMSNYRSLHLYQQNFGKEYGSGYSIEIVQDLQIFRLNPDRADLMVAGSTSGEVGQFTFSNHPANIDPFAHDGEEIKSGTRKLEFLPGGRYLVSLHENFKMYLWDFEQKKLVSRLPIMSREFAVNPVKPAEIFYCPAADIRVFDIKTLEDRRLSDDIALTSALRCDPSGKFLLAGSLSTGGAVILDTETGGKVGELKGGAFGVTESILISKAGFVVTGSAQGYSVFGKIK
ncbi:MAG: WD40 repeat domain-containing protein [Candidatus Berkelbacteria bacterium]|nr:WD40 repeat domain-containing protein [Candidatus Berkelbacteria bacterium]